MVKKAKKDKGKCKAAAGGASGSATDAASLLEQAQQHMDSLDLGAAIGVYQQILAAEPDNHAALDRLAEACLQAGEHDHALAALQHSVALRPEGAAERYMNLGQLHEGAEAVGWFERGVGVLRAALAKVAGTGRELEATHALAAALSTTAEIFLTDACEEPDAEARCEALAGEALSLVAALEKQELAEPYVTSASLRISQQRPDEAEPLLLQALEIFGGADEESPPAFDTRLSCGKMLMEVGKAAEALDLLTGLRLEDDESLELWYLVCCAALLANEPALALEEASQAADFAESAACPDEERQWLGQIAELREEARAAWAAAAAASEQGGP